VALTVAASAAAQLAGVGHPPPCGAECPGAFPVAQERTVQFLPSNPDGTCAQAAAGCCQNDRWPVSGEKTEAPVDVADRATPTLNIVVPCYDEEEALPETARRLSDVIDALIEHGLIRATSGIYFVDDGSKDRTWPIVA
jgi:hypothetical protein